MNVKELYIWGKRELERLAVAEPEASAQFLLREILGISKTQYLTKLEENVTQKQRNKYKKLIKRRQAHEPVWQIVGKVDFWGLPFFVNKNVLVPRPETEFLVQEAIRLISDFKEPKILDVGTGSGTIAVTLAHELPNATVWASDVSAKALAVAKKNAKVHKVFKKIKFFKSNLFTSKILKNQKFDIICANLPYIPTEDLGGLSMDVHHYEPRLALDGGAGGLVLYEDFLKQISDHLEKRAFILCEIGAGQGNDFKKLVKKHLPKATCLIEKDFGSFDRLAIIKID